ncbi:MAG: hypothetical protein KKD25_17140, partial [Gammaproteobacteria bacterium]|nr:hypothetical protein [Gammaproteobacteria bacterium]
MNAKDPLAPAFVASQAHVDEAILSSASADTVSGLTFSWFPQIRQALAVMDIYNAGARRSAGKAALEQ